MLGEGPYETTVPEITLEELLTAQGANSKRGSLRKGMEDLNRKILEEAKGLARVRVVWQEVKVRGVEKQVLLLENELMFRGNILPKVLGEADSVVLFAMTIGEDVDERIKKYTSEGETLEAFILDAAGSVIMAKAALNCISEIANIYHEKELGTTFPLGPGHSYWQGLEDVRAIIHYLKGEQIGIRLTDSNIMLPKKSIAMVMGVGANLPDFQGKTHCDFCHLKGNCNMRELGLNNC